MQRCIDCKWSKWCREVIIDYKLISCSPVMTAPVIKKLTKAEKVKFNNYRCFSRRIDK